MCLLDVLFVSFSLSLGHAAGSFSLFFFFFSAYFKAVSLYYRDGLYLDFVFPALCGLHLCYTEGIFPQLGLHVGQK